MNKTMKYALTNALITEAYVFLIAVFMFSAGKGILGRKETIFIPIAMLMLFVFSAAFCGTMVFGRPIMWYLDGKKKEAFSLMVHTLGILMVVTLIAFSFLVYFGR